MARLIDADALRYMTVAECSGHSIEYAMGWKTCVDWIKTLPTVDAVPVVRCKNCRHYFPDYMNTIDGNVVVYRCELDHDYGRDDYFCADGERRCDNDT